MINQSAIHHSFDYELIMVVLAYFMFRNIYIAYIGVKTLGITIFGKQTGDTNKIAYHLLCQKNLPNYFTMLFLEPFTFDYKFESYNPQANYTKIYFELYPPKE